MAKYDQGGGSERSSSEPSGRCPCGVNKTCQCKEKCTHERWSKWERDGDYHDTHHCINCGKTENRDLRNGY